MSCIAQCRRRRCTGCLPVSLQHEQAYLPTGGERNDLANFLCVCRSLTHGSQVRRRLAAVPARPDRLFRYATACSCSAVLLRAHTVVARRTNLAHSAWRPVQPTSVISRACASSCTLARSPDIPELTDLVFAVTAQSTNDCWAAQARLAKNPADGNTCLGDNGGGTGCKTKAKVGSCEIKMCQHPVGSGTVSKSCNSVASLAYSIIGGAAFPGQNTGTFSEGPSNLVVSVEQTDSKDTGYGDCGEPDTPCTF